jgi:hypothetical protein
LPYTYNPPLRVSKTIGEVSIDIRLTRSQRLGK